MDTHVTETMETMGDVNARRDARRRRILENSERRLLKITGRDNNVESEDISSQASLFIAEDVHKEAKGTGQSNVNGAVSDECHSRIKNEDILYSDDITWSYTAASGSKHNDTRKETEDGHGTPIQTKVSPTLSLTSRVNYIVLAIIINILLRLELDHLFGKAITALCFPIMLGRIYSHKNRWETENGNLLYTALILCNISPKLTYHLKTFVKLTYMILKDLALYIFSFTLVYYSLFYYSSYETDTITTLSI